MASTKPTTIDLYFSYWQQYIQPIEEEKIRSQFDQNLINTGQQLYGVEFALELSFLFLKQQNTDVPGEWING